MTELNVDEIPVVRPDDPTRLIGALSRRQLGSAYTAMIQSLRSPGPAETGKV
jgi:CIC family chloride channel protein